MKQLKGFWLVIWTVCLLASQAVAADLTLTPSAHDGFSRIDFQWQYPTTYRVQRNGNRIDISFSRSVDDDISKIQRTLPASVASSRLSDDRRTLSLILSRPYIVRDFSTGNEIVLDILGANDPKLPSVRSVQTPVVRTVSRPLPNASPLRLFAVQRKDLNQIVFSWDRQMPFQEKKGEGVYEITFDSSIPSGDLDLRQVISVLPQNLQNWRLSSSEGKLLLSVPVPAGYQVWAEQKGRQIYLNFSSAPPNVPSAGLSEQEKQPASVSTPQAQEGKDSKEKESVAESKPVVSPPRQVSTEEKPVKTDPEKVKAEKEEKTAIDLALQLADSDIIQLVNVSDPLGFDEEKAEAQVNRAIDAGYRVVSLAFPWQRRASAAAFRRDGYLWVVFDRKETIDFETEIELNKDIIYEMTQIPHSHATILRFVTAEGYNPSFRREGLLWILDLMYQPLRPRQSVELILQRRSPFGPRIFIPMEGTPQVLPLIDPEVGDLMYIVPTFDLNKGMPQLRSFVDATFLPTSQGVVVIPNIEELNVFASTSGLEVRGPKGGMRFSSDDILTYLARSKAEKNPLAEVLDVGAWAGNSPEQYYDVLQEIQAEVLQAPPNERPLKRLILARYYFANGMFPETLSVLDVIKADDKTFAENPAVIALRGAANFMMMRYPEAMDDFTAPQLDRNPYVDFWRAATLAATSNTPEKYLEPMKKNMGILQDYPPFIKTRLALAGLHAAVADGDEFSIQNFMESAYSSENTTAENSEITFYHALWQESNGAYNRALKEMTVLADGTDYYFRAMGGLEKIRIETKLGLITPEKRTEEIEKLMYAWRGDEFEYNLMTLLVAAYQDQQDYGKVLHLLKDMQIRFRDVPEGKKIAPMMEEMFQKLYLSDDETDLISPIKAIALYNEFNDLMPSGEKGSQIVRRLADRLVAIDLLEPAADLLERQLKKPMSPSEKGLVYTRLALIRLLNKEPEKALEALKESNEIKYSTKVRQQRRFIQIKALADMKKTEEAAKLLENDETPEGKLLRAEIYWEAQQWDKAADALRALIKRPQPGVALTPQEAQRVLDWATALRLAGRAKVVMRLRENFLPYMKETALAEPFDFITQSPQRGLLDYRDVPQEVQSAESFQTFAKEYIDMLKTKGLSETVQ